MVGQSLAAELRDPSTGEHQIRVNVGNLAEPQAAGAKQYRMVSVPLDFGDFTGTIADLLGDQPEFGPYDITRWRSFRFLPDQNRYGELSQSNLADVFRPEPGKAFWLIGSEANRLNTSPVTGRSVPGGEPYVVTVEPGWNQVANPFAYPVAWSGVTVTDATGMPAETMVSGPISGGHGDLDVLQPFSGFWLRNYDGEELKNQFPPVAFESETGKVDVVEWDWSVDLRVNNSGFGGGRGHRGGGDGCQYGLGCF